MSYTTVEVYCDAASHAQKHWVIERFAQMGPADWLPDPTWELRRGHAAHQRIDAVRGQAVTSASGLAAHTQIRDRYNLRCPKCGDSVPVRAENLYLVLDVLAAHGVSAISLEQLRARVRS